MSNISLYDHLPAEEAVEKSWNTPGRNRKYHEEAKKKVREAMPLLGRALDRVPERRSKEEIIKSLADALKGYYEYGYEWEVTQEEWEDDARDIYDIVFKGNEP